MADATEGRFVLGHRRLLGPHRRGLERHPLREAVLEGQGDARLPGRRARGRAHARTASSSRRSRSTRSRWSWPRSAAGCCRLAVERADGAFTNFLPDLGPAPGGRGHRGRSRRLRAPVPLLLPPGHARRGRADRPLHVLLLHHGPGLRGVLPLARPRRRDRPDGRGVEGEGPPEGRGRGAVGADRRDVHPRRARRDARAPRPLHRGRDHPSRSSRRSPRPTSSAT